VRITALIASTGRPQVLEQTLRGLLDRKRKPDEIIVSCITKSDYNADSAALPRCCFLTGARGLCAQLNAALDQKICKEGLVFVGDDDIELVSNYFEIVEQAFTDHRDLAALGGTIIRDGSTAGGEIAREEARRLVSEYERQAARQPARRGTGPGPSGVLYGCNITYRAELLLKERFDEKLPLYSLYFEADICRRMFKYGHVVGSAEAKIVHLAASSGRMPGLRMGYSQIANPYYLWSEKNTVTGRELAHLVPRVLLANSIKGLTTRDNVDHFGRFRGNMLALTDILRGRVCPLRVLDF
jgi:hypothetical protein